MLNAGETADKSKTIARASGPLITVAICTHNRAAFLEKAVRSVLRQMTGDAELLIVDNASTDDTPETGGASGRGQSLRESFAGRRTGIERRPQRRVEEGARGICAFFG